MFPTLRGKLWNFWCSSAIRGSGPALDDAAEIATHKMGVIVEIKSPVHSPGIERVVAHALQNNGTAHVLNYGGDSVALWSANGKVQDTFANQRLSTHDDGGRSPSR